MSDKRITIAAVREKIKTMTDRTLANCYLHYERHWGGVNYWLVFTDPDLKGERLQFNKIQEAWDWLNDFEKQNTERAAPGSYHTCTICGNEIPHNSGDGGRYIAKGWPTCCGKTMKWYQFNTAWKCAGDWRYLGQYSIQVKGGHVHYDDATATRTGRVRLRRLEGLRQINRYVDAETKVDLVRIAAVADGREEESDG